MMTVSKLQGHREVICLMSHYTDLIILPVPARRGGGRKRKKKEGCTIKQKESSRCFILGFRVFRGVFLIILRPKKNIFTIEFILAT